MKSSNVILAGLLAIIMIAADSHTIFAKPFVWARSGDALTLDPHAVNEGTTHALNHHIYEPLIIRDRTGKLEPALAISWRQTINPLVWSFQLRSDITFHDGQPLTAQDVIFSLQRALSPTSDLRTRLQGVRSFKAVAPLKIEITTRVQDPLLPIRLTDIFIMSKAWAEAHGVALPQNYLIGEKTFAATNANGTGPFKLVSREAGKLTKLTRNENYWGWRGTKPADRIASIDYRPIRSAKERITALLDGTVDFVQDVPVSELEVLRQAPDIQLEIGPENRVVFLGLSIKPTFNGKPNIIANADIREAIATTVDRRAIQRDVMRGQSIPTAVLAPPGINGFPFDLDNIPPRDLKRARTMVKKVVTGSTNEITLDCPNNRYVNDAAICQAIAKQLAEIGLKIDVKLRPKSDHFRIVRSGQSQLYLLGWGVPTFDSAYIFTNLFHTRTERLGTWNGTGYSNAEVDKQIASLSQSTESGARAREMSYIWQTARENRLYVPIHVQTLVYAMRKGVRIDVDISNAPKLKHATISQAASNAKSQ